MRILFEDREGRQRALPFANGEVLVGRAPGSALLLTDRNVSRRHARFVRQNGSVYLEDLGSANGTRVNGERIEGRRRIRPGDLVQIGDWDLALDGPLSDAPAERLPPPPGPPALGRHAGAAGDRVEAPGRSPRARFWPAAALLAIALAATLVGYVAGKGLRTAPPPPAAPARSAHLP
jgi:hypothetical protein